MTLKPAISTVTVPKALWDELLEEVRRRTTYSTSDDSYNDDTMISLHDRMLAIPSEHP